MTHDPGFAALKDHLIEVTGLSYYSDRDHDLAERVGAHAATAGDRQDRRPVSGAMTRRRPIP